MGQGGNRWKGNVPREDDFCLNKFIICEMPMETDRGSGGSLFE